MNLSDLLLDRENSVKKISSELCSAQKLIKDIEKQKDYLCWKVKKSNSIHKALVYQKKYLEAVVQSYQQSTKDQRHYPNKPKLRSVVQAVIFIGRLQWSVQKWQYNG